MEIIGADAVLVNLPLVVDWFGQAEVGLRILVISLFFSSVAFVLLL
jgi:hypothetical protein